MAKSGSSSTGWSLGSIIAGIVSWVHWHSVGWCILHVLLGWVYLLYYVTRYGFK